MNWLWPQKQHTETTALIRLGRVLHWVSIGLGAFIIFIGIFGFNSQSDGLFFASFGLVVALIGRGLRYVLADE